MVDGVGDISISFEYKSAVNALKDKFRRSVQIAQAVVADALLIDSLSYVPVLTGALIDSGRVEQIPTFEDASIFTRVVYGSDKLRYAARQHEEDFRHPSLGFKGRAHYLLKPFNANINYYMALYELTLSNILDDDEGLSAALSDIGIIPTIT